MPIQPRRPASSRIAFSCHRPTVIDVIQLQLGNRKSARGVDQNAIDGILQAGTDMGVSIAVERRIIIVGIVFVIVDEVALSPNTMLLPI